MLEKLVGERDLIGVSDDAALEPEVPIIALHFRRDADGGLIHPTAKRSECSAQRASISSLWWNRSASAETRCRVVIVPPMPRAVPWSLRCRCFLAASEARVEARGNRFRAFAGLIRVEQGGTGAAAQLHDVTKRSETKELVPIFSTASDRPASAVEELAPEIFVVGEQFERRRQAEVVAVFVQQLETERVNGAEPGAIEGAREFPARGWARNISSRARCCISSAARFAKVRTTSRGRASSASRRLCELHDAVSTARVLPEPAEATTEKLRSSSVGEAKTRCLILRLRHLK